MKKLIIILCVLIGIQYASYSQSLSPKSITPGGGYFTAGGNSLSFTMGETFTSNLQNGNMLMTLGQQQPYIELRIVNLKVYLEGFYGSTGLMDNTGAGGCLYATGISANPLDADTVTVSAMDAVTFLPVGVEKGILQTDGSLTVKFGSPVALGSSYYIKINHRNTIETWSASPILLSGITSYDFTISQSQAYGNNMVDAGVINSLPSAWAFYSGDISDAGLGLAGFQDGVVESQDYGDMENAVFITLTGYVPQDITGDGVVESADYSLMENAVYFTRFSQHP